MGDHALRHDLRAVSTPIADLVPWDRNPRINDDAAQRLARTIAVHGWTTPVLVQASTGRIIAGHTRAKAAAILGLTEVPVVRLDVDDSRATEIALADNRLGELAEWDDAGLAALLSELDDDGIDLDVLGWADDELDALLASAGGDCVIGASSSPPLAERFGAPPFSVLDARQGYWQDRKREWSGLGIVGEVGRGDNLIAYSETTSLGNKDTSIFDPVVCELAYRWFCPEGGQVVDPFAGGSVRGVVAGALGRLYWGCDLRQEQINANNKQADEIAPSVRPEWVCGDSCDELDNAPSADFVFSCPPYGDLEVYSDDAADLSTMRWADFLGTYREIISKAVGTLNGDRFACFVVGDYRDRAGNYRNFVSETIRAFLDAGCSLYNEAILVTAVASASMRASRQFMAGRKLVKTHQNVLVFVKGDAKKATEALGDVSGAIALDAWDTLRAAD